MIEQITPLWYLKRAIQAVDDNKCAECEQAMRGYMAAEKDRLDLQRIRMERGKPYPDVEKAERQHLLAILNEKLQAKRTSNNTYHASKPLRQTQETALPV